MIISIASKDILKSVFVTDSRVTKMSINLDSIITISPSSINVTSLEFKNSQPSSDVLTDRVWINSEGVIRHAVDYNLILPPVVLIPSETVTLTDGKSLIMSRGTTIAPNHNTTCIEVSGRDITISGGKFLGTWELEHQGQPNYTLSGMGPILDVINSARFILVRSNDWRGLKIKDCDFSRSRYTAITLYSKSSSNIQSQTECLFENLSFNENISHIEMLDGYGGNDTYIDNMVWRNCLFDTNAQGDYNIRAVYSQAAYNHILSFNVAWWNFVIDGCVFKNSGRMCLESWSSYAKHPNSSARGSYNVSVKNTQFLNTYYRAFSLGWGENFLFEDCVFNNDDTMPDGRPLGEGGGLELHPVKNAIFRRITGKGFSIGIVGGTGEWVVEDCDLVEHVNSPGLSPLISFNGTTNYWDLSSSFPQQLDPNSTLTVRNNRLYSDVNHIDPCWITGTLFDVEGNVITTPIYPAKGLILNNNKPMWISNYPYAGRQDEVLWTGNSWRYTRYRANGDLMNNGDILFRASSPTDSEYPWLIDFTTEIGSGDVSMDHWFMYPLINITNTTNLSALTYENNTFTLGPNCNKVASSIP